MNKGGHLLVGFIVGILFIYITHFTLGWFSYDFKNICLYAVIIGLFCLIPDTDHRNSVISFIFIGLSILGMAAGYNYNNDVILFSFFGLLIATFIAWTIGHRGFVHSILFGIIVSIPLIYLFSYQVSILAFICFYSHLAADEEFFKFI